LFDICPDRLLCDGLLPSDVDLIAVDATQLDFAARRIFLGHDVEEERVDHHFGFGLELLRIVRVGGFKNELREVCIPQRLDEVEKRWARADAVHQFQSLCYKFGEHGWNGAVLDLDEAP